KCECWAEEENPEDFSLRNGGPRPFPPPVHPDARYVVHKKGKYSWPCPKPTRHGSKWKERNPRNLGGRKWRGRPRSGRIENFTREMSNAAWNRQATSTPALSTYQANKFSKSAVKSWTFCMHPQTALAEWRAVVAGAIAASRHTA